MDKIKMLVGQEGPALSRLPGQVLAVGTDIDADEAQRLVDGDLAVEVVEEATSAEPTPPAAPAPAAIVKPAAAPAAKPAPAKRKAKTPAVAA